MSVIARILLMVNGAFVLALAASLFGLLQQGREDVIREQQAMKPVVEALIQSGKPQELLDLVGSNLRHVRLLQHPHEPDFEEGSETRVPNWFEHLFDHPDRGYQLAFTGSRGERRILVPDDSDEISEVWESATGLFWLFIATAVLANLAIYWGVRLGLRPLADFVNALDQLERGELQTRLGGYALPEARQVAQHFNHMAMALEQARHENQQLAQRVMEIQETERAALARELHDDLGQQVTGMRAQAFVVPMISDDEERLQQTAQRLLDGCDAIQAGFRRMIHQLYPVVLEQLGFRAALDELLQGIEQAFDVRCVLLGECQQEPPLEQSAHMYRLVQEAVHNAVRHGKAGHIEVVLTEKSDSRAGASDQTLSNIAIIDDGEGQARIVPGFGIRSMQERARLLHAQLTIDSVVGTGTQVTLSWQNNNKETP
ncbi:HAMP domain-containing sensor histidine kinase [Oceanobacter kriegii]|uniref:HAMP domain-containing sensor histidine kinase n=1 Tax=Oceanobacter kriegii TaxID=64972 RepID=UPI000400ADBF|nr:histidine kinase [Oceanobacter kriegii]